MSARERRARAPKGRYYTAVVLTVPDDWDKYMVFSGVGGVINPADWVKGCIEERIHFLPGADPRDRVRREMLDSATTVRMRNEKPRARAKK